LPEPVDPGTRLVDLVARAAEEKKGSQILRIAVGEVSVLADYFVIITGQSRPQVRAIANSIAESAYIENFTLRHAEGLGDSSWILQDFGFVIVHIFLPQERQFYQLEAFWGHAPRAIWVPGEAGHWEPYTQRLELLNDFDEAEDLEEEFV